MVHPLYITLEKSDLPTLIIDKEGSIGVGLYSKFKDLSQVVLVGGKKPVTEENLLFLPFKQQIPEIPSDTYSQIFYVARSVKEINELLPAFAQKAKQDKAKFFVVGERELLPLDVLENIFSKSNIATVVLLGDIFGNPLAHASRNFIEEILESAKIKKAVKLPGVGLSKIYPVYFEDVIIELTRLSFTYNKKNKLFFLHTQHPMTTLGLSHLLQKESPLLKVDFEKDEKPFENDSIPIEGEYLLPENYPASEKILASYKTLSKKEPEKIDDILRDENIEKKTKKSNSQLPAFIGKLVLFIFVFVVSLIVLPALLLVIFGFLGEKNLQNALTSIRKGSVESAKKETYLSSEFLFLTKQTLPIVRFELSLVGVKDITAIETKITLAQSAAEDFNKLLQISDLLKSFTAGGKNINTNSLLDSIANAKNLLFLAEQITNGKDIAKVNQIDSFSKINSFVNIIESAPSILGVNGQKKYLVLFQNNAELRPGGGFIGSYANLVFSKGNISDFAIHDVYDADGQLKGHIEPPFAIRRYLPSVHMYLRDSNFDVDFTKDAFLAAFLYEQEMHEKVDGVIAVDLSFLKEIVGVIGQIYLPNYKETITKDNFFDLAEKHSEKNFFPGSSQKKDFLKETFLAMQNKIASGKGIDYLKLLEVISLSSEQKHILFAFANINTQDLFTANGFSSSIWDNRKNDSGTINDFLGINEANLGVNKVNYFISRKINQKVTITGDGTVNEEALINLTNSSSGQWPSGPYKNFIRFILPGGATINRIVINGVEQKIVPAITNFLLYEAKNFVPPSGLEVERTEESGKTIYGFLTSIPPKENQAITIFYQLAQKIDLSLPKNTYDNIYFKQPGTETYPLLFSLSLPQDHKSLSFSKDIKKENSSLIFEGDTSSEKKFNVVFTKN